MNLRQRPRKKSRLWVAIVGALLLAMGGWFLGHAVFQHFFPPQTESAAPPEPPVSVVPEPVPDPPPPVAVQPPSAPTGEGGPSTGKARQPIFDRNMDTMAVSFKQSSVYIKPIELQAGQNAVGHLAEVLGLPLEKLQTEVRTEGNFLWLKRNLNVETAQKISKSNLSGVYLVDELQRYYPLHNHAAHVVGFMKDAQGLAGAEFIYDPILSGNRPLVSQYINLPGIELTDIPPAGAAVVLSIDIDMQVLLEKKIQFLLQQSSAKSVSACMIETGSGEIIAMAETQDYHPNIYWKASNAAHQNKLLSEPIPMAGFNAFVKAAAELAIGNLPPEMATREEEAEHTLLPRVMKIAKNEPPAPKTQESQVWQPGIHLSPPFLWPLNFSQQEEGLASFCAKLGLGVTGSGLADSHIETGTDKAKAKPACPVNDAAWRTPPLSILAAFAQLTNGGRAISPHLLRGIWRMDNSTFHPTSYKASAVIGSDASAAFIRFVDGLLPPGPGDDLIIESISSMVKETGHEPGRVHEEESPRTIEDSFRFATMTLAAGRQQGEHQLALLLLVDGAKLNLNLPSPLRRAAAEILSQGNGVMAKRWANTVKAPKLESEAFLYQKWSLSQTLDTTRPVIDSIVNQEMPDLVGMSLRKALQALQGYTLKVNIQGSGRVRRQTPAAGVRLKGIREATLDLKMDN